MVSILMPLLLASAGTGLSATDAVALDQSVEVVWLDAGAAYERGDYAPYQPSLGYVTTTSYDPWCVGCVGWGSAARSGFYLSVGFGTYGTYAALGYGTLYPSRPIWYRPVWHRPAYHVPYYARPYRVRYHPVWGYHHPGRGPRWRHYSRPYSRPYYYDRSGFGIHIQYAGSSFFGDLFYRSGDLFDRRDSYYSYARPRTRILTGAFDRPFDGSGRRVQVRRAVRRNEFTPRTDVRQAMARYRVGRAAYASERTPWSASSMRVARVRNPNERGAVTRRGSNGGDMRAGRPRLIREDVSSARVSASSLRQASARARSETQPRARTFAQPATARTAQQRSTATRASSQVERSARPAPSARSSRPAVARRAVSTPRPSVSRQSRPSVSRQSRPSVSRQSRPSFRPARSASRPAAASRSSRPRTSVAQSSRRGGSAAARSRGSGGARRGGGKKR